MSGCSTPSSPARPAWCSPSTSPRSAWPGSRTDDGLVHLAIPELLDELDDLATEPAPGGSADFPFVLSAGERRSFTANTIFRDPAWRKRDAAGSLRISPADAEGLGVVDGDARPRHHQAGQRDGRRRGQRDHAARPRLAAQRPRASTTREEDGAAVVTGAAPNELTASEDRDWIAGTPWHKHVPARLERVGVA